MASGCLLGLTPLLFLDGPKHASADHRDCGDKGTTSTEEKK